MEEVMYDHSSLVICFVLLVAMATALELGYRAGRRRAPRGNEGVRSQLNAAQGSLLGLLALLLGFTFSLALQRYDERSKAVVDEANAIGTAMLRARLLHESIQPRAEGILRDYVDVRVATSRVSLDQAEEREALLVQATDVQERLWQLIDEALAIDDRPITTGLFLQAVNEMIDSYGRRDAALDRHVPEPVLFLLFITFVLVCVIVGVTSGVSETRPPTSMFVMALLIVLLVFIIIDLDRPRRGIIEINQSSLYALQQPAGQPAR